MDKIRQVVTPEPEQGLVLVTRDAQFAVAPVGSLALGGKECTITPANVGTFVTGLSTSFRDGENYPESSPFRRVASQIGALTLVVGAVRDAADTRGQYFRKQLFTQDRQLPGQKAAEDARLPEDDIVTAGDELIGELGRYLAYNGAQQESYDGFRANHDKAVQTGDAFAQRALADMESIVRQKSKTMQEPPKGRILGDFASELHAEDVAATVESLLNHLQKSIPSAHVDAMKQWEAMRQILADTNKLSDTLAAGVLRQVMDYVLRYQSVVAATRLVAGGLKDRAQVVLDAPSGLSPNTRPEGQVVTVPGQITGGARQVPSILNIVQSQG
jgi:hypothetical protein